MTLPSRLTVVCAALLCCALPQRAAAQTEERIISFHTGSCLGSAGKPGIQDCGSASPYELVPAAGKFLLRSARSHQCLFSNKDKRFAFYACTPTFNDQHWEWLWPGDDTDPALRHSLEGYRMIRNVNSGRCLFANADKRFGVAECATKTPDQFWRLGKDPSGLKSAHSGRCLSPGGTVAECSEATTLETSAIAADKGAVMLRHAGTNTCLFASKEGQSGWSPCSSKSPDQRWTPQRTSGAPDEVKGAEGAWRMLKNQVSGQCLFSNQDGRFGVFTCTPGYADQYWHKAPLGSP